jgi:hypothetical protein
VTRKGMGSTVALCVQHEEIDISKSTHTSYPPAYCLLLIWYDILAGIH